MMRTAQMPMPIELKNLMLKFNRIGCLLSEDAVLSGDPGLVAEQTMVVAELNKIYAQIFEFLDQHRQH
jgi:hypothetical protein